jgi:Leucine-rich repeat (LRR) protein
VLLSFFDTGNNNLQGSIPADFCLLNFLQVVALSNSNGVELPSCASQLPQLKELYLDGNNYQGQLPSMFHESTSLTYLDLSKNAFTGSIRELFPNNNVDAGFANLQTLLLNDNDLSGDIPQSSFRRLRNLERLELMGNPNLTGSLNEICKGSLMFAEADCSVVSCRCCQNGPSCPSF